MITPEEAARDFEEIVGWEYRFGASGDGEKKVDCSGAWVRCARKHGLSVYHGSNTLFRKECSASGSIKTEDDLAVGMAVFKRRFDGGEPDSYKNDGIGNLYHVGAVVSVNPLRIVHATSPKARVDTTLSDWALWGWLKIVVGGSQTVEARLSALEKRVSALEDKA